MSETKTLHVEVKDADKGIVEAVFATLNVIDSDGDVTIPGAFKDGAEVRISAYGHGSWAGALPVGKGVIREDGDKAILDGKFFLNTANGRDTFQTIKELGGLGQWSYGFDVVESESGQFEEKDVRFLKDLDVHEVSPVLLGAGVGTATISVKEARAAIGMAEQHPSFPDHFKSVLGDVTGLIGRAEAWGLGEDVKAGRVLSTANHQRLSEMAEALLAAHASLSAMLAETDPGKQRRMVESAFLRFQHGCSTTP